MANPTARVAPGALIWSAISVGPLPRAGLPAMLSILVAESRFPEVKFHIEFGELVSAELVDSARMPGPGVQCLPFTSIL